MDKIRWKNVRYPHVKFFTVYTVYTCVPAPLHIHTCSMLAHTHPTLQFALVQESSLVSGMCSTWIDCWLVCDLG